LGVQLHVISEERLTTGNIHREDAVKPGSRPWSWDRSYCGASSPFGALGYGRHVAVQFSAQLHHIMSANLPSQHQLLYLLLSLTQIPYLSFRLSQLLFLRLI
jgi:hypothetical protein